MSIRSSKFRKLVLNLGLISVAGILSACNVESATNKTPQPVEGNATSTVNLRVIETTDIHSYLTAYDYYKDKVVDNFGLTRAASLVKQARSEVKNSVLVDNGDLIQGSLIGQYAVDEGLKNQIHPAFQAMNTMGYDVGNVGNHEFNFGLEYLNKALAGAKYPILNANVYDAKTGKNYFTPYVIKEKEVVDTDGNKQVIKIGYIGFTPVQILSWDADKLTGKVTTESIYESAKKWIPKMKAEGADVIVAVPHSGIGSDKVVTGAANEVNMLSKVPGIDAIMFGHSHAVFPSPEFSTVPGSDIAKGTLNGVPSVMPGRWGDHIGIVDLTIKQINGKWVVDHSLSQGSTRAIYDVKTKKALVQDDPTVAAALKNVHENTIKYASSSFGVLGDDLVGYLALSQEDYAVKLVQQAQRWKVEQFIKNNPKYKDYKALSAAAPFKYGERHNDITNYTKVKKGPFAIKNVADVYLYPNNFTIVEVTGAQVRRWLECSANLFNRIDPNSNSQQNLWNQRFRTYNYDSIYGVQYQIDVTKFPKYLSSCKTPNSGPVESRIVDLTYNGQPLKDDDKFLVGTNNYRASGSSMAFPEWIVRDDNNQMTNQEVIQEYIAHETKEKGKVTIDKSFNWSIKPIPGGEKLTIVMFSFPQPEAIEWVMKNSVWKLKKLGTDEAGFQLYNIDLSKPVIPFNK